MKGFIRANPVKSILIGICIALSIKGVIAYNHSSNGLCVDRVGRFAPKYLSDEEFIRYALGPAFYAQYEQSPNIDHIGEYLKDYPECCKVFRNKDRSEKSVSALGMWVWHGNVVVRIYSKKLKPILKDGREPNGMERFNQVAYILVDNCLYGDEYLYEIMPGG